MKDKPFSPKDFKIKEFIIKSNFVFAKHVRVFIGSCNSQDKNIANHLFILP